MHPTCAAGSISHRETVVNLECHIFVADTQNAVIRAVVAVNNNTIQTLVGSGLSGYIGDGGPPASAKLNNPFSVIGGASATLLIADTDNSRIRQLVLRRKPSFLLAFAVMTLLALSACGGSSNSSSANQSKRNPEIGSYSIKVQGTTAAQPNPVLITTVGLTVQ